MPGRAVQRVAADFLRLPGRTLPVPGWFPLVAEPVHARIGWDDRRPLLRVNGALMRLDLDEYVQRRIFYGCHEIAEARFVRRLLRPGDHVLDIGANVGFFTLLAARIVGPGGRVIALEPVPHNADALEANLRLNGFGNVEVTRAAAGDHRGEIRLGLDHPDERERGVSGHYTEGGARETISVPVTTVDERLAGGPRLRLAKIDVEGAEPRVLAGMAATLAENPPDAILIEINGRALGRQGFDPNQVVAPLRRAGYELRAIGPTGRARAGGGLRHGRTGGATAGGGRLELIWRGLRGRDRLESVAAMRGGAAA